MVPQLLSCPLAVIGITGIFAAWQRARHAWFAPRERLLRERVTYMLWVAATEG